MAVGRAAGGDACLALCPQGCSTARFLASIQPKVPAPSPRTEPPCRRPHGGRGMAGRGGGWRRQRDTRYLADHLPLLLGRRYGSVDSAANGRSDAESASESSRRTSRQPSLESRRSLDLSDRWVPTSSVACRVPSQSAVVGPCSRGEANTSPGKGGLVPPRGPPPPISPPRIALQRSSVGTAPGVSWPRGVPILLLPTPQFMGAMDVPSVPVPLV